MDHFNNGSRDCPCEPSCLEERFPATVSSVTWPSKKYMVSMTILYHQYFLVKQEVDDDIKLVFNIFQDTAANSYGVDKERASENLVKINVYYTSLNERKVEDKIDYSIQVSRTTWTM